VQFSRKQNLKKYQTKRLKRRKKINTKAKNTSGPVLNEIGKIRKPFETA